MIQTYQATLPHGITLSCRAAGAAHAPRVLLLHGFPEAAFAWDGVMQALAPHARCLAPNLRGFEKSSSPAEVEAYRARHLMQDIEALITHSGGPVDLLVAHDWGGALAWNLAAMRPELMKRLLIINSPHPATFLRELRANPAQQAASAYMNFLCRPDAEALLAENDFARLWPFFERMGGKTWLNDTLRARYREVWGMGLTGGLNFYRASPLRPPSPADPRAAQALQAVVLPDALVTSRVPTAVLWGEGDHALLPCLLDGLDRWVPDLRLTRVPQASHWIVHEQPERVVEEIRRNLAAG
ncbi:MAG: alpha/beta fold hydrolase [Rubrivivax sp.]|jgi:pimeloyl-ACP methyl ester carboxylesterase